jgi:outer membrane receptor protein involved in Fe transport
LRTSGVDVSISYGFDFADMGWANVGSLNASVIGTWLDTSITDTGSGAPAFDCAGFWGFAGTGVGHEDCGAPDPEWRHRFRLTWDTPWHFDITGTWRYYGAVDRHGANTTVVNGGAAGQFLASSIDAFNWFDLSGNVHLSKSVVARFGINNILDTDPPLTGSYQPAGTVNGNSFQGIYDTLGRFMFAGLTIDF